MVKQSRRSSPSGFQDQALSLPLGRVAEAARAFRQLRVRPQGATSGADHSRAGSPLGQPRSPKKRKATGRLDKEFILKDDKVKRSTGEKERALHQIVLWVLCL